MKVILYMAITTNDLIAGKNDDVEWVSEESWQSYLSVVKQTKCAVVGRRTYDLMPEEEFVKDCFYVVFTHEKPSKPKVSNLMFANESPEEILKMLKKKGYKQVCVCGGSKINTLFMKEGLIDEIYLDVEPVVLGKGIPLFAPENFRFDLELLEVKKLNPRTAQLHYGVKK